MMPGTAAAGRSASSIRYTTIAEQLPLANDDSVGRRRRYRARLAAVAGGLVAVVLLLAAVFNRKGSAAAQAQAQQLAKKSKGASKSSKAAYNVAASTCEDPNFNKNTMKLAFESPIVSMYLHQVGDRKHELSDVLFMDEKFYAVSDSSWNLFELDRSLPYFSHKNRIIEPVGLDMHNEEESSYEAIFYDDGTLYLVRESIETTGDNGQAFHATVIEAQLVPATDEDDGRGKYNAVRECTVEELFEGDSKGFEGAMHMHDSGGNVYMLALCEGNHCSEGARGREKGNGILVVLERVIGVDGTCVWKTLRRISVPASAAFTDYSGINLQQGTNRVLISSQEDSKLWVGAMTTDAEGFFEPMSSELVGGAVFDFPRSNSCEVIYCNLEGVTWVTDQLIVAVSDRMKGRGRQAARCAQKDQSIHVFSLPYNWEKAFLAAGGI